MTERKIRVAYVINDLILGGAQMVVLGIVGAIDRTRFESVVYYLNDLAKDRPTVINELRSQNVRVVPVGEEGKRGIAGSFFRMLKQFRAEKPDIAHLHLPNAVISGGAACVLLGVPFVMHEHQTHQMHSWKIRLAFKPLRPFASVSVCYGESIERDIAPDSYTLAASPEALTRRTYTVLNGIDMKKIREIHSDSDRAAKRASLGVAPDEILLLSVGRLVEWKGHRMLIEAFAEARKHVPNLVLRIAGDGEQRRELAELVKTLNLGRSVQLLGSRTDVYEILHAGDIFSSVFTYPGGAGPGAGAVVIATYEAMGFGLPVINGDFQPARDFFEDGENALLVEPNKSALANAIIELAKHPERRASIGAAAAKFAEERLDWKKIVPIYERLYELSVS